MTAIDYRIEFSIQRERDGVDDDFVEIGFGSSGAWSNIEAAVHAIASDLKNGIWETEGDMPDPAEVVAEIRAEARP